MKPSPWGKLLACPELAALFMLALLLAPAGPLCAQLPGAKLNVVHPLPPIAPAWLEGYAVRWPIRIVGEPHKQSAETVLARVPAGNWVKPDAADLAVQAANGKVLPHAVLSHDPAGETILQFPRSGNDPWYWIYAVHPTGKGGPKADVKTLREGMTVEVRDWAGTDRSGWAKVRETLDKTPAILANGIVGDVIQSGCPARPDQSYKFATSYRGFLSIDKPGTYRFFLNAEDAAFLFIDGFKVYEQAGGGKMLGTVKASALEKIMGSVELKAGVVPIEVHHVVGEDAQAQGRCALIWKAPGQAKVSYVPPTAFARPIYARVAALEKPGGECPGLFTHGLEDTVEAPGIRLFLMRFEAQGPGKDADFVWDFGDGTGGVGRSFTHVYFKEGDFNVTLKAAGSPLPPLRRRVHVWAEPGDANPLSLPAAVDALAAMEWKKLDPTHLREVFSYLQACNQPNRFALLDQVAEFMLGRKDVDLEERSQLHLARLEALTAANRAGEALKLGEQALTEYARTPALLVRVQLGVAAIHQYHFRDAAAASKIYKDILDKHSRTEHPNLRLAGIRWGDLFAEAGDLPRASETYRIAATLGGDKFQSTANTDATTRGALLRIAEQKLRSGEVHATRQLLERIEMEYPGRRLDGLYCFLKAESDRVAGRYEEAQRHYEMIFKLPQWAGYRDRATFGIADSFLRMGELEKAKKWFTDLKNSFPAYFEMHKLAEVVTLLDERLERLTAARAKGDAGSAEFRGFLTSFEPTESEWFGDQKELTAVRAPGLSGAHVALMDIYPKPLDQIVYDKPLTNLTPGGTYWVEFWLRDLLRVAGTTGQPPHVQVLLMSDGKVKASTLQTIYPPRNTHHDWHRHGIRIKMPPATDGMLRLSFGNTTGCLLLDRVSIRPIDDRHLDSLLLFQQGAQTP